MSDKEIIDLDALLNPPEQYTLSMVSGIPSIHRIIEALLHVSTEPLTLELLNEILGFPGITPIHQAFGARCGKD